MHNSLSVNKINRPQEAPAKLLAAKDSKEDVTGGKFVKLPTTSKLDKKKSKKARVEIEYEMETDQPRVKTRK